MWAEVSGYAPMAGSCKHGNDPLGSIEGGKFDSQEGLCFALWN